MSQNDKKKRRKHFLQTDYSIPGFSFVQAFILIFLLSIIFFVGSLIIENISTQFTIPVMIVVSILVGFTISFIQFYKKEGTRKSVVVVGILFALLAFIMIFTLYYADILI